MSGILVGIIIIRVYEYYYDKKGDLNWLATLRTRLKEYREKSLMKQSELAKLVGVRRETIVHLENGKYNPSLKLAMDIAKIFQVSVEELFWFEE